MRRLLLVPTLLLAASAAFADCRFYFADQYDFSNNLGYTVDLEETSNGTTPCVLSKLSLVLGVADGKAFHWIVANPQWQTGHLYQLQAVISPTGSQLYLDGQLMGSVQGGFQPFARYVAANEIPSWASAPAAYVITQSGLTIDDGISNLTLPPGGQTLVPLPLQLMSPAPQWQGNFPAQNVQPTTITIQFQIDPAVSDPHVFDPYVDRYGQTTYSDWPSKVHTDDDLTTAAVNERAWLDANPPLPNLDPYGGSMSAGWQDVATGYYHTVLANGRWWLITPLGNPCFYISISDMAQVWQYTPVTGREGMFAELPDRSGAFSGAWGKNVWGEGGNTSYLSFQVVNMIRKYGADWQTQANSLAGERALKWGFGGAGKWSPRYPNLPVMPVLEHGDVPNVVRHPDVFDPAIQAQLVTSLTNAIGADLNNPFIVGWSIGNEYDEIITTDETVQMLALGAAVPVKRALVDYALASLYSGNLASLASSWKIKASSVDDAYAASPAAPAGDIETLRQYFANIYYRTLYQTVKTIDPNHLFLGWWIVPNWWINSQDWMLQAANTDVVGFDYYVPKFVEPYLDALIQAAGKPVLIGEFSFPPAYLGLRGFDTAQYALNVGASDSDSGDRYAQWLADTSNYPYMIGVSWFEYRDEPISGRGPGSGPALVIGEHDAFGLVDTTDNPKFDLVNKVLAANIAALQSLGLLSVPSATLHQP